MTEFENEAVLRIQENGRNTDLQRAGLDFTIISTLPKYSYNYFWLGAQLSNTLRTLLQCRN